MRTARAKSTTLRTLLLAFLLVPLTALVLAACGGDTLSPDPVAEAAGKTVQAGSSKVSFTGSMEGRGLARPLTLHGEGAIDGTRRGRMSFDMSSFARAVGGAAGSPSAWKGETVFAGTVVYMKFPFLSKTLPEAKPWLKLDLAAVGKEAGIDLTQFRQMGQNDPSQSLQMLRATSGDVEEVGHERVRGVETTHYRAQVDVERVAEQLPERSRAAIEASMDELERAIGTKKLPVEVWIDADGLVRRMSQRLELKRPGGEEPLVVRYTIELYDFGSPVTVSLPAASEVTDVAELLKQTGANAGR